MQTALLIVLIILVLLIGFWLWYCLSCLSDALENAFIEVHKRLDELETKLDQRR